MVLINSGYKVNKTNLASVYLLGKVCILVMNPCHQDKVYENCN
jgi:hypothetical protein